MARVLFLDNERILVNDLPALLKKEGLVVRPTTSIAEALEMLEAEEFDAVLLDIMMPPANDMQDEDVDYGRETGVAVAAKMKAIKPDVPIVAFTVLRDPKIHTRMREAGIGKIISKPAEIELIARVLLDVTGKK